jgi:hypothetical protein
LLALFGRRIKFLLTLDFDRVIIKRINLKYVTTKVMIFKNIVKQPRKKQLRREKNVNHECQTINEIIELNYTNSYIQHK